MPVSSAKLPEDNTVQAYSDCMNLQVPRILGGQHADVLCRHSEGIRNVDNEVRDLNYVEGLP